MYKEHTHQTLKELGLNTYELKVWTALLTKKIATAGELSDIANVPRSRSYDVLDSLEKKGFVETRKGRPLKYVAISPRKAVEGVKNMVEKQLDKRTKTFTTLKSTPIMQELNELHIQGKELVEPETLSAGLRGQTNVYNHIEARMNAAKRSVVLVTTSSGLERKADRFKKVFANLSKKGISVVVKAPLTKENEKTVKELKKTTNVENTSIKARFCVIDGDEIVFMVMDDREVHPTYDVGVWVRTPFAHQISKTIM